MTRLGRIEDDHLDNHSGLLSLSSDLQLANFASKIPAQIVPELLPRDELHTVLLKKKKRMSIRTRMESLAEDEIYAPG